MFITIEHETGMANLILWPDRFAAQRGLVLSAAIIACHGRVRQGGMVVHVVTDWLEDLSDLLRSLDEQDGPSTPAWPRRQYDAPRVCRIHRMDRAGRGSGAVRDTSIPDRLGLGIKAPPPDSRGEPREAARRTSIGSIAKIPGQVTADTTSTC